MHWCFIDIVLGLREVHDIIDLQRLWMKEKYEYHRRAQQKIVRVWCKPIVQPESRGSV